MLIRNSQRLVHTRRSRSHNSRGHGTGNHTPHRRRSTAIHTSHIRIHSVRSRLVLRLLLHWHSVRWPARLLLLLLLWGNTASVHHLRCSRWWTLHHWLHTGMHPIGAWWRLIGRLVMLRRTGVAPSRHWLLGNTASGTGSHGIGHATQCCSRRDRPTLGCSPGRLPHAGSTSLLLLLLGRWSSIIVWIVISASCSGIASSALVIVIVVVPASATSSAAGGGLL
mmetsp:Transcript_25205/g.54302  ORF Transcript_25205/g.54302 Transcript_25205/m.54302 type:complete len:223 (+) Transcript_25205:877-1545(+)